ncbi:unnamed protein product [Sphagnum troendelagicum]|uniref:Kinesin-like protein n=1 Tax=Sphagnum troendelagicum TaxID=128251 RepID=A0ABP0UFE9_9BRYO
MSADSCETGDREIWKNAEDSSSGRGGRKHEIARTLEIRSFFTALSSWFTLYITQSVQRQKDQSSCFIREMPYGECECRMKVHLRMRPSSKPSSALHFDEAKAMVRIDVQKKQSNSGGPTKLYTDQIVFSLDSVIRTTDQETVFDLCAKEIVDDVLRGYNGTIMTYGHVGSGKTFTMTGGNKEYAHRGIIPRAVHRLFQEKEEKPEAGITVQMSYLEVYNEGIYDLLQRKGEPGGCLMILEDNGLLEIPGLAKIPVENEAETLKLYFEGEKLRSYSNHTLNQMSSRSHCVLTFYIERQTGIRTFQDVTVAKLNLVDLAGNERLKNIADYRGHLRREAMGINKSLSFLLQTVYALRLGQDYIPFRHSRLTTLLKESLGGNCKTVLVVCAWPEDYFLDETIGALRFAQWVKCLKTTAVINKKLDFASTKRRYVREISDLRQELALKDALSGRMGASYNELTEEAKTQLRNKIEAFITDEKELDQIPIENFRQVKELFCLFKEAHVSIHAQLEKVLAEYRLIPPPEEPPPEDNGVGELACEGFHVGIAPLDARPERHAKPGPLSPEAKSCGVSMLTYKEKDVPEGVWECESDIRNDAFLEFKHATQEGQEQETVLKNKEEELRTKRRYARDISASLNKAKQEVEELKKLIEEKGVIKPSNCAELEKRAALMTRFRFVKAVYHKVHKELKIAKQNLEALQQEVRDQKEKLLVSFYSWFDNVAKYRGEETEQFMASMA